MKYYAEIVCRATGEVVKRCEYESEREADRAELGMCINLNGKDYFTRSGRVEENKREVEG